MSKLTIEQELLGTTKKQHKNEQFIRATMDSVGSQKATGTFDRVLRTTGTTKWELFIMKLRRLPQFALFGLAAIAVLSISGTAYAAYHLWSKPSANVEGNVITLQDCRQNGDHARVLTDSKNSKSPEHIAQILEAHCEIGNIQQWAIHEQGAQPGDVMLPYTIDTIGKDAITVVGEDKASRSLSIDRATIVIVSGKPVRADQLHTGDHIAYVATNGTGQVRAIIKLDLPIDSYRTATQNLVITQDGCIGNPDELCRQGGGITGLRIDTNGELASLEFPDDWHTKAVEGKVVSYSDDTITIKGSSGASYTIKTPSALVTAFNADLGRNQGLHIMPGDTVSVQYRQAENADKRVIMPSEFEQMTLLAIGDAKAGALQKY